MPWGLPVFSPRSIACVRTVEDGRRPAASDQLRPPRMPRLPEILAPAGDEASLAAALAAGADAVYFGLDEGLNARARAKNFSLATLPATCDQVHRAGAKAYLTVNTLVFEEELP